MGILDDFINNIKMQRKQYQAEEDKAIEAQAARENAAKVKAAREKAAAEKAAAEKAASEKAGTGKPSEKGFIGGVVDRMKEQRKQFEEAQKKGAPTEKVPTKTLKEQNVLTDQNVMELPKTIIQFGRTFTHAPGSPEHLWIDDAARSVYIDDIDAYLKSGGKVEQRGITSAMDPFMYDIYTNKGGPIGQARYYKHENIVISLVPDPFAKYR